MASIYQSQDAFITWQVVFLWIKNVGGLIQKLSFSHLCMKDGLRPLFSQLCMKDGLRPFILYER